VIIRRFYDEKLAQASYLVGCARTGEALVVDPRRDVAVYLAAAEAENLRITHITETHIHADFVSGARELAERTGGRLHLSDEGGAAWKYAFAGDYDAVLLEDGDAFYVGNVRIDVLHTPGHTPEHLVFVVTDTAAADRPMGVFTGDFIFVGDVGRPDLLERAAHHAGTMERGARDLFGSLQRFRSALPDYVQIWPGHGAGSACGKALGAVPQSTLGYEKLFNWGLVEADEDAFVEAVLAGQPEPPMYFAAMKRINRQGPRLLAAIAPPPQLGEAQLAALADDGATVVDVRAAAEFGAAHVPRSISVPYGASFTTWAGSVLPVDEEYFLIVDTTTTSLDAVRRDLLSIGLDRIAGWFDAGVIAARAAAGRPVNALASVSAEATTKLLRAGGITLVDVRNGTEWQQGHIPGSVNHPLGRLPETMARIPRDRPVVVHCLSGARAVVAISVLHAHGFADVRQLAGDFAGWRAGGRPIVAAGTPPTTELAVAS
jgi:hydroxyacylglutathione hydrolase